MAGEGDNPPEDVGAEGGSIDFLRVIADPADEGREYMRAWGESQGFDRFDLAHANERLAHYNDWRVKGVYARSRRAGDVRPIRGRPAKPAARAMIPPRLAAGPRC